MRRVDVLGLLAVGLIAGAVATRNAVAHPVSVYPEHYEIVARPGQTPPQDLLVASTYGFLLSHDGGATWRWGCEAAFGVTDSWAPEYELTAAGTITATTGGGLYRSTDGCTWDSAGGSAGQDVASTSAIGSDGTLWLGSNLLPAAVLRSTDDGLTWSPTGSLGADVDWVESIAVAPSNPMRIYVTGSIFAGTRQVRMWKSDDAGASWTPISTTALLPAAASELQVASIDPTDPDRLFVRVTNTPATGQEALFRTIDAGAGWTEVLRVSDYIPGVTVRSSGAVIVATRGNGLFASPGGTSPFTMMTGQRLTTGCLTELRDGSLWVCADNFGDDRMGVGRSSDGETWTKVMTMLDLVGPVRCPAGTIQYDECDRGNWCYYKELYSIPSDEVSCVQPDAGVDPMPDPPPGCIDCRGGGDAGLTTAGWLLFALMVSRARPTRRARALGGSSRK